MIMRIIKTIIKEMILRIGIPIYIRRRLQILKEMKSQLNQSQYSTNRNFIDSVKLKTCHWYWQGLNSEHEILNARHTGYSRKHINMCGGGGGITVMGFFFLPFQGLVFFPLLLSLRSCCCWSHPFAICLQATRVQMCWGQHKGNFFFFKCRAGGWRRNKNLQE